MQDKVKFTLIGTTSKSLEDIEQEIMSGKSKGEIAAELQIKVIPVERPHLSALQSQ